MVSRTTEILINWAEFESELSEAELFGGDSSKKDNYSVR